MFYQNLYKNHLNYLALIVDSTLIHFKFSCVNAELSRTAEEFY